MVLTLVVGHRASVPRTVAVRLTVSRGRFPQTSPIQGQVETSTELQLPCLCATDKELLTTCLVRVCVPEAVFLSADHCA